MLETLRVLVPGSKVPVAKITSPTLLTTQSQTISLQGL